jgi:hypothetical protein
LASFDVDTLSAAVREFMQARDFEIIGVRKDGKIAGFIKARSLVEQLRPFDDAIVLDEAAPLLGLKKRGDGLRSFRSFSGIFRQGAGHARLTSKLPRLTPPLRCVFGYRWLGVGLLATSITGRGGGWRRNRPRRTVHDLLPGRSRVSPEC